MKEGDWPSLTDYGDALQHPGRSLYNFEHLREAEVEKNRLKRPKGRSGNFAVVYKLTGTTGNVAAKFFKSPDEDRQRRYEAVSQHLKRNQTGYTVGFDYHEHGVYVNSAYFPMLLMEWVEGKTLGSWFHERVLAKDKDSLRAIADEWVKLVEGLQKAEIAHGDLQHGNVLVVKGKLKLVDYDGMYVPALRDAPQIERGVDDYQHQERGAQKLGPGLDNFSAWIILLSLRAMAADPSLYMKYKKRPEDTEPHENMLFVKADVHPTAGDARKAEIWRDLKASPDLEVREWAANLWACLDKPFDQVPPFVMDPFRSLRTVCATRPPDWEQIARLGKGLGTKKPPTELKDQIDLALKRVACRDRLKAALDKGDLRAIKDAYVPQLLDDWDACKKLVQQVKATGKRTQALQEMEAAASAIGDGRTFVKKWNLSGSDLAGTPDAERFQKLADQWRYRIAAAEAFLSVLNTTGASDRAIAKAWREVERHAPTHPDIGTSQQTRGKLALRRVTTLERLNAIPDEATEETDQKLEAAWDDELLKGCPEAAEAALRVERARSRLAALKELRAVIALADKIGQEDGVLAAAKKLPGSYFDDKLKDRLRLSRERLTLEDELKKALDSDSDRLIKTAWERAKKRLSVFRIPGTVERCKLAIERCGLLDELAAIDTSTPLDTQDEAWESLWNDELLDDCTDAAALRPDHDLAMRRLKAYRDLESALKRGSPVEVRTRFANPILAGYPPVKKKEALISEFVRKADDVARILEKLKTAKGGLILSEADLQVLRTSPELFDPESRRQIEASIAMRFGTTLKLSKIDDGFELGSSFITLRWTWPDFSLIQCCHLAFDDHGPLKSPGEYPQICTPDDHRRAGGGMRILADSGDYATIWPVINLGWKELRGQPLVIGPMQETASKNGSRSKLR